jgi:hypothetical protein
LVFGTRNVDGTSGSKSCFSAGMPVIDSAPIDVPW